MRWDKATDRISDEGVLQKEVLILMITKIKK